jgi:hypothetical protein
MPADFQIESLRPPKRNLPPGAGPGRPAGGVNRITKDLKRGIIDAAVELGSDGCGTDGLQGYLRMCAQKYPKHYLALLGKLLPMQLNTDGLGSVNVSFNVTSVPSGSFLTAESLERFSPEWPLLDHEPQHVEQHEQQGPDQRIEPIEPRSPEEARLLAELSNLSVEELMRRAEELARRAGVSLVDQG